MTSTPAGSQEQDPACERSYVPVVLPYNAGIDYDHLAKLMAMLVATIYVVGVVVVNLRLARFGITGMGLLREQYVYAGQ